MKPSDFKIILNGIEAVAKAFISVEGKEFDRFWKNSTFRTLSKSVVASAEETVSSVIASSEKGNPVLNIANEMKERSLVVVESIKQYAAYIANEGKDSISIQSKTSSDFDIEHPVLQNSNKIHLSSSQEENFEILQKSESLDSTSNAAQGINFATSNKILEIQHIPNIKAKLNTTVSERGHLIDKYDKAVSEKKLPKSRRPPKLSDDAREKKVPSSRLSRGFAFAGLTVELGVGAVKEFVRRGFSLKSDEDSASQSLLSKNVFLSEENVERIVRTLCKVRGAALKLGQMLSIQDDSMINPQLAVIFERVRAAADYMPSAQMMKVLEKELGHEWREKFSEFHEKPFAAASIGQVHYAKLLDGTEVAVKIQYPGIAESIESDVKNIKNIVHRMNILPKGLYVENLMAVAEKELKREVDYVHEAKSGKHFKKLLEPFPQFLVPKVFDELSTSHVLITELVSGKAVNKLEAEDQELRNRVCKNLLHLCLMEIFLFRFMQTDPNWSNFLYDSDTKQIALLDFGACNEYKQEFVDKYMGIIKAASEQNRADVLRFSKDIGFLTGYETKVMEEAHTDSVMILGEAFASKEPFNFKRQNMTHRIHDLVPIMLKHRLTAPPEDTYSLHRKMSGIFLLCTKLGAIIDCRKLFNEVYEEYRAKT